MEMMDLSLDFTTDELCDSEQELYPPDPKFPYICGETIVTTSQGGYEVYIINTNLKISQWTLNTYYLLALHLIFLSSIYQVQLKAIYVPMNIHLQF